MQKGTIIVIIICFLIIGGVAYSLYKSSNTTTQTMNTASGAIGTPATSGNKQVVLHTEKGNIIIELLSEIAPNTAANFLKLAGDGFYDGTRFHRVIAGFMIQGGDPLTKDDSQMTRWGTGGSGTNINAEFNAESHVRGIVSMARSNDPNSASSQFFIVVADSTFLDRQYTAFGKVISGMEVADAIVAAGEGKELPDNPIVINNTEVK